MVGTRFGREVKIGGQESRSQFCHQLLERLGLVAEPLTEGAGQAGVMAGPMGQFVREDAVIAFRVAEGLQRWHLHEVAASVVVGFGATMPDDGAGCDREPLGTVDALQPGRQRRGRGPVAVRQAVDLVGVEDGIAFQERISRSLSSPVASSVSLRLKLDA